MTIQIKKNDLGMQRKRKILVSYLLPSQKSKILDRLRSAIVLTGSKITKCLNFLAFFKDFLAKNLDF